jgi:hypothetical protein
MFKKSQAAYELHNGIEQLLTEQELAYDVDKDGDIALQQGSTRVFLRAMDLTEEHTLVKIFAPVSVEISRFNADVGQALLEANASLVFGKFSLDTENRVIWFEHMLLGKHLDAETLLVGIGMIASTADDYDETVSNMAGGRRFFE